MQMVCRNLSLLCVMAGVFGSAAIAAEPQAVVLPPIYTTIDGTLTPVEAALPTFHLSYTGWRSAGPDEQVSYYGHTSTSGPQGWADYEFPAWSDAQSPIAEIYDPNIEMIFQTPQLWTNLSYLYDPDLDYRMVSVSLAAMVCVDEGCVPTYPG